LAHLGVQGFEVHGGLAFIAIATEHAGRPFQKLAPPLSNLRRMNIKFLG